MFSDVIGDSRRLLEDVIGVSRTAQGTAFSGVVGHARTVLEGVVGDARRELKKKTPCKTKLEKKSMQRNIVTFLSVTS